MQKPINIKQNMNIMDMSQGQKIAAALYLVTGHLPQQDPLRIKVRVCAVDILSLESRTTAAQELRHLLKTALLANLISSKNVMILDRELDAYTKHTNSVSILESFFETPHTSPEAVAKAPIKDMSFIKRDSNNVLEVKEKRQKQIIEFINLRKSVGIKDISELFSDISEKTIQRELNSLVALGKITKRGSKRWSVYMAVVEKSV